MGRDVNTSQGRDQTETRLRMTNTARKVPNDDDIVMPLLARSSCPRFDARDTRSHYGNNDNGIH